MRSWPFDLAAAGWELTAIELKERVQCLSLIVARIGELLLALSFGSSCQRLQVQRLKKETVELGRHLGIFA
jgi:hypothetical protein